MIKTLGYFRTLLPYFKANRWHLLAGLVCLLLVDLLQLLIPLLIKRAIDMLTVGVASNTSLMRLGGLILTIAFFIAICRYAWRHLIFGHSRKVEEGLRNRLFSHLQRLSDNFFHRYKTGDIMARAINDINAIRMATGMGLVALTDGLILGLAAIVFMVSINLRLALITLIPAPLVIILTRILTRRMSLGFENVQRQFSELTERVREGFAGIWVIKAFNRENWQHQKVVREGNRYIQYNLSLARTMAFFFPMMAIFTNTGLAIVIWLGGRKVIFGQISAGDFVAFTSYLNLLTWPMMAMGWVTNLLQRAAASMKRINSILDEEPDIQSAHSPVYIRPLRGKIEIINLSYQYPGQTHPVLNGLSLTIQPGQTLALVGRVGCGKTTLLSAIPRMIKIPPRSIFIDGVDVLDMELSTLRGAIGFVPQQGLLFSDSIRNNILLGREEISEEQIRHAMEIACIAEEIEQLDAGIDTIVGERGATLSGGQRQRITLARALVADPPILLLDNAFSMVDVKTENQILENLLRARKYKTNLIVSHRASTLSWADKVAVMDQGKIVDLGTHQALLQRNTLYRRLYEEKRYSEELEVI